jgi:matrixin
VSVSPRILLCALLGLALVPAAASAADALPPAVPVPAADALMARAHTLAIARWGVEPCGGRVNVMWAHMGAGINARSQWMSTDVHNPATYTQCSITYNLDVDWDWPKLCTVVEHELGHLDGHDHVNDPHDVMSPYYIYPTNECAARTAPASVARAPTTKTVPVLAKKKSAKRKATSNRKKAAARKAAARHASARKAAARRAAEARAAYSRRHTHSAVV